MHPCPSLRWQLSNSMNDLHPLDNLDYITSNDINIFLNRKLIEEKLKGMELMPIIEVKSDGNPTY